MMRRVRSMGVGAAGEQDLLPVSRAASQSPKPFGKKSKVAGKAAVGAVVVFGVYALLMLSRMGSSKVAHQAHHSDDWGADHLDFYGYGDHAVSDTHHHDQHHSGGWEQNWDHHGSADTHHRSTGGHGDAHSWDQQHHQPQHHESHWDQQHHQQQHHDSHWQEQQHQEHHDSHWDQHHQHQEHQHQEHQHQEHQHQEHQHHAAHADAHAHGDPRAAAHHHAHAAPAPAPQEGRHIHDERAAHDAAHTDAGHDAADDELRPHHHADLEHAAKHGVVVEGDDEEGHYHAYYHTGHHGHEEPHYHLEYHNYPGHHGDETHDPNYLGNHHGVDTFNQDHGYEPHAQDAHAHAADALRHGSGGHAEQQHHQQHHQADHQQQHEQQQHAHHEQHNWREWLHDRMHHHKSADEQHGAAAHDPGRDRAALDPASDLQWHLENNPLPDPTEDPAHHVDHNHEPRYLHHPDHARPQGLYTLSATESDGRRRHLSDFAGKVTLVVNVASHCSLTEQNYRGLKAVYDKYHEHGLEILAFPSNEFGGQEPGSNREIRDFVHYHYNATWPLFEKTTVNGPNANPVYRWLKRELPVQDGGGGGKGPGRDLAWNFIKILVDQRGRPVRTISQAWDQAEVENAVYDLLLAGEQEYNDWLEEQEAAQHRSGAWSRGADAHRQQHGGEARHYDNVDTQQSWQQHGLHHGGEAHHDAHHHHAQQQQHQHQHQHQQQQPAVNHHHGDAHDAHAAVNAGKHGAWNDASHGHGGHHDGAAAGHHDEWGHIFNDVTDDWHKQHIADSAAAYDSTHGHYFGQGGYLQQAHADAAHQQAQEQGHQVLGDLGMKLGLGGDAHAHVQAHVDDYVRQTNSHAGGHQQQHQQQHHQHQQQHHQQHHQQYHH